MALTKFSSGASKPKFGMGARRPAAAAAAVAPAEDQVAGDEELGDEEQLGAGEGTEEQLPEEETAGDEAAEEVAEEAAPTPAPAAKTTTKKTTAPKAAAAAPAAAAPAAPKAARKVKDDDGLGAAPARKTAALPEPGVRVTQDDIETLFANLLADPEKAAEYGLPAIGTRARAIAILRAPFKFLIEEVLPTNEARVAPGVIFAHEEIDGRVYRNPRSEGDTDTHLLVNGRLSAKLSIKLAEGETIVGSIDGENFIPAGKAGGKKAGAKKK